jgi:hypothetical protein
MKAGVAGPGAVGGGALMMREVNFVYRKQIRPVVEDGATVMDRIFGRPREDGHSDRHPGKS